MIENRMLTPHLHTVNTLLNCLKIYNLYLMKLVPYEIIHMFMTSNTGIPLHYIYFLRCYIHIISSLIVASKTRTWERGCLWFKSYRKVFTLHVNEQCKISRWCKVWHTYVTEDLNPKIQHKSSKGITKNFLWAIT